MSYKDGWKALHLDMPDKIPRTEYSANFHWDLIQKVTGIPVSSKSPVEVRLEAAKEFIRLWDYGFFWNIMPFDKQFGNAHSKMGHNAFQQDGSDFSAEKYQFLEEPEDVYALDFWETYGIRPPETLVPQFNADYQLMRTSYPDTVNMTGIYTTCMSGAIEILGWDMLLIAAGTDYEEFGGFMNRYAEWNLQYYEALAKSDSPVVMVHDDIVWTGGAFLSAEFYRKYIFANYEKLFQPLFDAGKTVLYTSDGNYTQFIDDIAACGVHGFVMEPGTDMKYVCETYGKSHVIVGNADTRILLYGSPADIEKEVKRCIDLGRGCPGYFMAVGNHIPVNTPVDNCLYYNDYFEKYRIRR